MVPAASNVHCLAGLCKPVCKRTRGASKVARFTGNLIVSPGVPKLNVGSSILLARFASITRGFVLRSAMYDSMASWQEGVVAIARTVAPVSRRKASRPSLPPLPA